MKSKLSCASSLRWLERERERERESQGPLFPIYRWRRKQRATHTFFLSRIFIRIRIQRSQEPNKNSHVCELILVSSVSQCV